MAFRVEISPKALGNFDEIAAHIQQHGSFESAQSWFNGIVISIRSLEEMPSRCPLADESDDL
jgi:plasmid stabilization system protein ParE